jgi:hypothetical protein
MKEVMGFLARDTLVKACMSFRIEALCTADGSFIEYVDCQCVSLLIFYYFNKIGWFSAVLCHLKERRKKFRIYRCHTVDPRSGISKKSGSGSIFITSDPIAVNPDLKH